MRLGDEVKGERWKVESGKLKVENGSKLFKRVKNGSRLSRIRSKMVEIETKTEIYGIIEEIYGTAGGRGCTPEGHRD